MDLLIKILLGLNAFALGFIFKLFWSEIKGGRDFQKEILLQLGLIRIDLARAFERIDGHGSQIHDLKKSKR